MNIVLNDEGMNIVLNDEGTDQQKDSFKGFSDVENSKVEVTHHSQQININSFVDNVQQDCTFHLNPGGFLVSQF